MARFSAKRVRESFEEHLQNPKYRGYELILEEGQGALPADTFIRQVAETYYDVEIEIHRFWTKGNNRSNRRFVLMIGLPVTDDKARDTEVRNNFVANL